MGALHDQIAETMASIPKPMPDDFAPHLWLDDGGICMLADYPFDGKRRAQYSLGFKLTDDPALNGKALLATWQRLWLCLELTRLGDIDRLRTMGMIDSPPSPD